MLRDDHPAMVGGRSIFPSTVVEAAASPRLLVSGVNQRKVGKRIAKGRWRGLPIYTLTLEERATCPTSCEQWANCYGNHMPFARRHAPGAAFEDRLEGELATLGKKHSDGFAVRLHILGDFYSLDYVGFWERALASIPALHVFGFTAHDPDSDIGKRIAGLASDRCWIRFSGVDAIVVATVADSRHVVCPAQLDQTDCCATCGLCWTMRKPVAFLRH